MDPLGKPVTDVGDDHGAGIGVGGGGTAAPNTQNSQAARMAAESQSGFNAGVGGAHASGGLPTGHTSTGSTGSATSNTPIADKFMSGGAGTGAGVGSGLGSGQDAVSGAYEGGAATDALTGQSRATETGAGVGYMGENLPSSTERTDGGLFGAGLAGAGAGAGAGLAGVGAGEGLAHSSRTDAPLTKGAQLGTAGTGGSDAVGTGHAYGTGVGAEGGSGGHYGSTGTGAGTGNGAGAAAGGGVGAAGAGAAGATSGDNSTGHYGTQEKDFDRGAPVSKPGELDSGGPHSLIFDKETGKYVHRHEIKGGALADDARPTTTSTQE